MTDRPPLPDRRAAIATLVATQGASPKDAGSSMWVDDEGKILGAVTIGGCVDAQVIEAATAVLASGVPSLIQMALGDEDAWALGMTCAGTVEVLIEPFNPMVDGLMITLAARVDQEMAAGRAAVTAVPLDGSTGRVMVFHDGTVAGAVLDSAVQLEVVAVALSMGAAGKSGCAVAGGRRYFFDVHLPPLTLVVFGATHVAIPLTAMAKAAGMRVIVVDGRSRFATPDRFPLADQVIVGMPSEIAQQLSLGASSLVVLLSHDYKYDLPVLRAVLESDAAYIGCLGSARRARAMLDYLAAQGIDRERLSRVRIPVGLDIGARSAAEIALSVVAEALAVQRGRGGGAMRDRVTPAPAT